MPSSFLNQSSQEHHELDRHSIHCHDTYLCIVLVNRLLGCNSSESGERQRQRNSCLQKYKQWVSSSRRISPLGALFFLIKFVALRSWPLLSFKVSVYCLRVIKEARQGMHFLLV